MKARLASPWLGSTATAGEAITHTHHTGSVVKILVIITELAVVVAVLAGINWCSVLLCL